MKIRVPNPFYFDHGVIQYYAEDNEIYYKVLVWNKDGFKQYSVDNAKLNSKTPEQILNALPMILNGMGSQ